MTKPLFSIIIPVYNYGAVVHRAIQSVLGQPGNDAELIVINDGSTDDSHEILDDILQKSETPFTLIHQKNQGPAATRNNGIEASNGVFLIFLDADDKLTPLSLNHFRDVITEAHQEVDVILGGHESVSIKNGKIKSYTPGSVPDTPFAKAKAYLIDKSIRISNGAIAIRRSIFDHYRFPERFRNSEDLPVFAHSLVNYRVKTTDNNLVSIYKHDDSLRHNIAHARQIGTSIVDEMFDHALPETVQKLRKPYLCRRLLSLSRTLYIADDKTGCRHFYHQAVFLDWTTIFNWQYTKKYLRSFV
jgi:glycosyltransferase involved in cell wall biosynthesis